MVYEYKKDLNQRYWEYQKEKFPHWQTYFERPYGEDGRPPVFLKTQATQNIIFNPGASQNQKDQLIALVPLCERQKWFRSMNSSQALAQSIFGNLATYDQLPVLANVIDDDGVEIFKKARLSKENFHMEYKISQLHEPRPTSLDTYISGDFRIAIECKFTESEIGTCSRPRLQPNSSNYEKDFCDGSYSYQRTRQERCSLTEIGVLYWKFIPGLFKWVNDIDHENCPLNRNYQLVRNVLAASVKPDGSLSHHDNYAILIYDERNPSFQEGGQGWQTYVDTRNALIETDILHKCSWQKILKVMREEHCLPWLTEQLALKYGL